MRKEKSKLRDEQGNCKGGKKPNHTHDAGSAMLCFLQPLRRQDACHGCHCSSFALMEVRVFFWNESNEGSGGDGCENAEAKIAMKANGRVYL